MPEADAALAQERAQGAVSDEDPIFEQFSEVQAQKGSPSPFYCFALVRRREASSLWCFDSSLGVSSAGVGTWHEAFL
jgi:hypothetical protein